MDIHLLRYFIEIARCGSVTAAAKALDVSQPTLSRQVRRLEAELGVQLLDRSASGVVLTEAGRKALRGARQTVRSFDAMSEAIMAVDEQQPLRMGMPTLAMALLTNELLARLHRPGNPLRLSVSEATNTMLIEAVRSGQLDLAIATEVPPSPQLKAVVLWTEQLFLVGPPSAKKAPATISIAEAAQLPVIVGRAADPIRQCIAGAFERHGHSLRVEMELEGIASIKQVLEGRRLWAFAPWLSVRAEVEAGKLDCRAVDGLFIRRYLITPSGASANPRVRALSRLVQELSVQLLQGKDWVRA